MIIIRANLTEITKSWKRHMWHGAIPWEEFRKEKKLNQQLSDMVLKCIRDDALHELVHRITFTHTPHEVHGYIHLSGEDIKSAYQIIDQLRLQGIYSYVHPANEELRGPRFEPGYTNMTTLV